MKDDQEHRCERDPSLAKNIHYSSFPSGYPEQIPDGAHANPDVLKDIRTNLIQQGKTYTRTCLFRMFVPAINGLMKTPDPNKGK